MALSSPPPQSDPSLFSSSLTLPLSYCYYQSPQKNLHRKLPIINYNISQSKNQNKNPSSIQRSAQPTPKSAPLRQPKPIPSKPTPRSAPKPSTQATPSTSKPRSALRPSTQATPCSTQAISFFLAMENRGRERRERTEKRERAEEKKLKREKISGKMKDKGKKRKSLNRRVGNSFLMDEECTVVFYL